MISAEQTELGRVYQVRGGALNTTYYTRADEATLNRIVKKLGRRSSLAMTTEELRTLRGAERALRGQSVLMIRHTRYKTLSDECKEMTGYVEAPNDYNFSEIPEPPKYDS